MSDFFIPTTNKDDYWTKKQQEAQNTLPQQNTQNDYWQTRTQALQEQKEERLANYNRYGVDVPDEYYEQFNKIISQTENPEQAQEEAYRIGSAIKYSQMYGMPLEEAYSKVDALNEANFTDLQDQKGRFEALSDMFSLGNNNVKLGQLGQQLMTANATGDTELAQNLMAQIDAINQQNNLLQDNTPRSWVMEALEAGAQSLPFTGYVAAAGLFGNFIAPAVGTGAAFAASSYLAAGQEYLDMLANGASHQTASLVASISGGFQGIIEANLGITKGIVKGTAKLIGKEAAEKAAKVSLEEITRKVAKRFHFGAGKKLLINYLEQYGLNVLGEGVEEFLQEITSIIGQEAAAAMDGYDIPDDDFKSIVKQTTEAFRGGILGALALGFIPAGINTAADIKDYRLIRNLAETIDSDDMFEKAVENSKIFEGMSDDYKKEVIHQIKDEARKRMEFEASQNAEEIAEVQMAEERETITDEEGNEIEAEPDAVVREESGKLMYADDENINDDGTVSGSFRAGDKTKKEDNIYGYINYTADEDNKTVTIDDFKMKKSREGLRGELFDEFAQKYAGYDIQWNPAKNIAIQIKEDLVENNPSGAVKGLNYYADQNAVADAGTRAKVAAEVKKNIHNITRSTDANGNVTYSRTELSNKQVASAVALLEAAAKRTGMNLTEYVNKTFGNQIFGSQEDFANTAAAQGDTATGKAGGVNQGVAQKGWQQYGQQIKAVIYAGENADFSTWAHELAHVFQNQLEGDLKAQAERAFGVVNGDWINSKYTFKDGHVDSAAEAFAYGFQDWLKTGQAESEEMKNIFQKFAEFIVRAFNSLKDFINLTPEIKDVYNQLLSGDDSLLKAAEQAVEAEDKRYRAQMQQNARNAENKRKAQAEQEKKQAEAEREEASETTDFTEETALTTPEQAEAQLQEATNETTESTNAIDNALENSNLTDEQKTQIADVLKDPDTTVVEKAEASTEAASSAYDDAQMPFDLFQEEAEKAGKNMQIAVNSSYDKYANEEVKGNAEDILDAKISENSTNNRGKTKVWSIYKDLKLHKGSEIVGKKIELDESAIPTENGWNQLREILDIFRNKSFETFRYVLIDQTGEIKKQYAITAKMPGFAFVGTGSTNEEQKSYLAKIYTEALNTNCKIAFVHNHPSGDIQQSEDDERATETLRRVPGLYLGHMILDHNAYNLNTQSDKNGSVWTQYLINIDEKDSLLKQPKKHKELFNQKIKNRTDLESIASQLNEVDKGTIPVCFINHSSQITSIAYFPEELFTADNVEELRKTLEDTALKAGTLYTYAITDNTDIAEFINKNNDVLRFCDIASYSGQSNTIYIEPGRNLYFYDKEGVAGQETVNQISDDYDTSNKNPLLFMKAYHGSPHNFDKFSTENIGSGEGAQAFGWGLYFTNQESIARFYADKLANEPKRISLVAKNDYLKSRKKSLRDVENKEKYEARILKNIDHFRKELKQAQKENDESQIKFYEGLIDDSYKQLDEKERLSLVESFKKDIEKAQQEIAELKASMKNNRNLYTVELSNDGYLLWDKPISDEIKTVIYNSIREQGSENFDFSMSFWSSKNEAFESGEKLYNAISEATGGEKQASLFLKNAGFVGIDYPAHSLSGITSENERNYVIFDDEDVQIVNHLFYQTESELQEEAKSFDNWQEFMEYCEVMHSMDDVSPIPSDADAQWYQSFWETSHGLETEAAKNEQAMRDNAKAEGALPIAVDAYFNTMLRSNPEMLDNFLQAVADIDAIDFDSDEWRNAADETDAAERERIDQLKDFISITLSDYNWQTAIKRIQGGHEIAEGLRKRLIGEMTDSFKTRDFRALYSAVMGDEQYAVDEKDSIASQLNERLSKYQKRYYDILKPNEDIARVSPERRKRIAEAMNNADIAAKIKSGKLKLDDELDAYIKSLEAQEKDLQNQLNELEKETQNDYQRLADAERRKLLKLHDELLLARSKMTKSDAEINRKINKGLKITEKYRRESQNMKANYDELFRKFTDLRNTIQITAEVQAALDRQEKVAGLKEDLNNKQKEKSLTAEVKKMRIQLVKKAMRRVPFNRIDYENARTIIAIQRMLEPNLLGGVNRFIGIDSPFLRGVISQVVTDNEYKQKLLNYLRKANKSSQAFVDFVKKLEDLKTIKDFDSWTAKERKYAIKHLPKENWIRDLNLTELAKEREESIDLDIDTKEKQTPKIDPKTGRVMTNKDGDVIYETTFVLDASDELKKLVQDAVGADTFNMIENVPFAEWTTEDLERLAQRIDELYTEGRDMLAAKQEARRRENDAIRRRIEDAIKETGITINDDDTPEEKAAKQEKINKILGLNKGLKGTEAGKDKGILAKFDRLIHGYWDANVLRVGRILDNQSEGVNVQMLYRREDDCFNTKTRSIMARGETVKKVMVDNKITEEGLAQTVAVPQLSTEFTVDELLYFLAADEDYEIDETKAATAVDPLDMNDDWAATSRNAVMFGNMMSDTMSQEQKEAWVAQDKAMEEAYANDQLTAEQKQLDAIGMLDKHPGTTAYIKECHARWGAALAAANDFIAQHPEYKALMEAIQADYASQYERMNEVSINEFNQPVHRVKAYVPLVRRESNGDTNVNQVKEDLLGAYGADAGKQWVNKGMTKRRVQMNPLHQKPVQTGLFRTWGDSIERTEHFIAYAPYVRQLNAVYKSRDAAYTRRFMESRYGKGMVEYIDSYINEVANPNANKIREKGAEFLHILRGKTAPAYLGWKFSAIVKQGLTSPWPYMQFVNPAEYLAACFKCINGGYDAIKQKSAYMASRVMDPINELVDEMADNAKSKADRAWSKFAKKGMAGLEWIDWTCVAPGWLACYQKEYNRLEAQSEAAYQAKKAELTEKNMMVDIGTGEWMSAEQIEAQAQKELMADIETAAVRYADDCTRQCQPSSRVTDLAPLFKNSSEAMKAFLQFQTSLNVIWQNIRYDIPYAIRQKQFKRIAGTVCGYVFAGIFMNSVMSGVKGDDDDDETQALRNLIYYSTTQFTDAIPMIGSDVTNAVDQIITGKRGFMNSGTDMTPSATKMMSALQKATQGDWKKAAALTSEGIGLYLGAPVSGIKEINKLLGKPLDEGDVDLLRGLGDVYGIAGDFIEE